MGWLDRLRGSEESKAVGDVLTELSFRTRRQAPVKQAKEFLQAYSTMPWLRAAVHKVARAVATTEWRIVTVRRRGRPVRDRVFRMGGLEERSRRLKQLARQSDVEVEELTEHPALDLLRDGANNFTNETDFWVLTQAPIDILGEMFWLMERNGAGMPVKLWPIPPDWIQDIPLPRVENPQFKVQLFGRETSVPQSEMIWFRDPDPSDPYGRGSGTARALADELDTAEFASKWQKSFFYNGARPDYLAVVEGAREEELKRLKQSWMDDHRGYWRSFIPRFTNRAVKIERLTQTAQDMQLSDLQKHQRDTVTQVYGIPPELLGILESSNRATIESAGFLFAKWVLVPRLELLRSTLQNRLLSAFDDRLLLDYESPVPEDREIRREVMRSAPFAFKVDEFREIAGFDPLPEQRGQVFYVPFNMFPSEQPGDPPPLTQPNNPAEPQPPAPQPEPAAAASFKDLTIEEDRDSLLDETLLASLLIGELVPPIALTVDRFGQETLRGLEIDQDFNLGDPEVVEFLGAAIGERLSEVHETTRRQVAEAILAGLEAGEPLDVMSKRIEGVFADFETGRTPLIGRTESVLGAAVGTMAAMRQAHVPGKQWVTMRDERVRDTHRALDGVVVGLNDLFTSPSGAQALHPGGFGVANEDVNCRCVLVPVPVPERALDESRRAAAWKQFEQERLPFEQAIANAARRAFAAQQASLLAGLARERI